MRTANAKNKRTGESTLRAAREGRFLSRAAFAGAEATPDMRMRQHAEQADAVAAAL